MLTKFSDAVVEEDFALAWTVANIVPAAALPASHCWPVLGLVSPPRLATVFSEQDYLNTSLLAILPCSKTGHFSRDQTRAKNGALLHTACKEGFLQSSAMLNHPKHSSYGTAAFTYVQVVEHLKALSKEGGEELLQMWPNSSLSVEVVFGKLFKYLENEVCPWSHYKHHPAVSGLPQCP